MSEKVEMTEEEMQEYLAFKKQQEKARLIQARKENREAYQELVDEQLKLAIPELQSLSEQISAVKRTTFNNFKEVLNVKDGVMGLSRADQHSHTFTSSDGQMRITLGANTIDGYRDTVEDGITMVRQYIESLATDDKSRALVSAVMRLLSRDQKGTLKASRVLQLRKMAEESGDDTFIEGVRIIEEAYQPTETRQYIRAEVRGDDGGWKSIPLGMTEA